MKKLTKLFMIIATVAIALVATLGFTACGAGDGIHVIIRNDGSGTRTAFDSIVQLNAENPITPDHQSIATNGGVLTAVAANENAIGYVSGYTVNTTVRAITIDGRTHTAADFPVSRPFIVAYNTHVGLNNLEPLTRAFWEFVISTNAQQTITQTLVAGLGVREAFTFPAVRPEGSQVLIRGSSSVTPIMQTLRARFLELAPAGWALTVADIDIDGPGTGVGFGDVNGILHTTNRYRTIAMASANLNATQAGNSVQNTIAIDTIAIIVHPNNNITNLTMTQLRGIFRGIYRHWADMA